MIASAAVASWSARAGPSTQVTGGTPGFRYQSPSSPNAQGNATFSCIGTPTCTGVYEFRSFGPTEGTQCSGGNALAWSDSIVITGLAIDTPGNLQGTITLKNIPIEIAAPPNCTAVTRQDMALAYTGTWSGSSGNLVNSNLQTFTGFINAKNTAPPPSPPAFPVTVSSIITPAVANATAQFQPRPQDAGTVASIFVFAHVPASLLGKSVGKAGGSDYCVLAQLTPDGNLVSVSAAALQSYLSGVLAASGNSVNILNNVPTPRVAGASFYIGYGPNAGTMFTAGTYQSALNVPGASQCNANLASSSVVSSPAPLSGLWYNASESGWGINFTQRRDTIFAAWYDYDSAGNPKWYVAPNCVIPSSSNATTGTCSGALYDVTGPAFFRPTFNPALVVPRSVGSLQVNFSSPGAATMTYNVSGLSRIVPIVRQVFQSAALAPAVDFTDLWYNPSESGWGMSISHQYGAMFLAWYVYDDSGKPVWYVTDNCVVTGNSCSGTVYRTTGPPLGPGFDSLQVRAFEAGTILLVFSDANSGVLAFTVKGSSQPSTKAIVRQVF